MFRDIEKSSMICPIISPTLKTIFLESRVQLGLQYSALHSYEENDRKWKNLSLNEEEGGTN